MTAEPDYRKLLLSLIGSLGLCDHMGDVADDVWEVLKEIGIEIPEEVSDLNDLGHWLGKNHGVQTVWGSALWDEDTDCPKCDLVYFKCECPTD